MPIYNPPRTDIFNVLDYGAWGDGLSDDTAAIQAAIADAYNVGGRVYFPATGNGYGFTNLKLFAGVSYEGAVMANSTLKRKTGSTGTAIREATSAEGNPSGATGIWIRNLRVNGNSTAGDGIDLGNQGGPQLNFCSGLDNVHVRDFTSGTGMRINQNAAKCNYIWSNSNQVGIETSGGAGVYSGMWAENNSAQDLIIAGARDEFFGVHTEPATGSTESIKITGSDHGFVGVTTTFGGGITKSNVILFATGAARNSLYNVNVVGGTFTHGIYVQAWSRGTGNVQTHFPFFFDTANGSAAWLYDQSSNTLTTMGGELIDCDGTIVAAKLVQGTQNVSDLATTMMLMGG